MSKSTRRDFIRSSLVAFGAFIFSSSLLKPLSAIAKEAEPKDSGTTKASALPDGEKKLDESDAVAKALGFHHNVKDTDFTKYPQRNKPEAKNQYCKNCAYYTDKNGAWGKCQMLSNGVVAAEGWCGSWSKKA